jgi:ribonucleoside-diphosphate reductase alpha chain
MASDTLTATAQHQHQHQQHLPGLGPEPQAAAVGKGKGKGKGAAPHPEGGPPPAQQLEKKECPDARLEFHATADKYAFIDAVLGAYRADYDRVDFDELAARARDGVPERCTGREIVEALINICSSKLASHYQYDSLAGALFLRTLYEDTPPTYSAAAALLHADNQLADHVWDAVRLHGPEIDARIRDERDRGLTFFGLKTLCKGYLLSAGAATTGAGSGAPGAGAAAWRLAERPQYLFMRVALGIHGAEDLPRAFETYDLLSTKHMMHATPTLFNAGTRHAQNSSCFLLQVPRDSLGAIFDTLKSCGMISKHAGGIGLAIHEIRAKGSAIRSCNGVSSGIVPMLRMFNACSRYVNQAGKRNGSMAIYLEPWHADVDDFLELRKNYGNEEQRTRDLFTALWIPDLFMERVQAGGQWSLMSPDACPGLNRAWGAEFEALYTRYEREGRAVRTVAARDLWSRIVESQLETGMPYMLYKDQANAKSNQQHLGTIQCSNLCTEVMQYTDDSEVAVCNLCSIGLPAFVDAAAGAFRFDELHRVTRVATRNLDLVIDRNFYPVEAARRSNLRHRPVGIGIQGLADVFALLGLPFDSDAARALNRDIFETMYHAALTESVALAREKGRFETFAGSPASRGVLQFDMWGVDPGAGRYDWAAMRADVEAHGLRNSLLLAPMPTASTSQILGYNECFEPFTSNLYKRNTLAGEFIVLNRHLVRALEAAGLWSDDMKNKIILHNGSVQGIADIPEPIRAVFKTAWEIRQRTVIDMAADRGPFICQSQSLNLFMEEPDYQKLTAMHFHSWKRGLKTGMYYLRTRPKARAQQFTLEPSLVCTRGGAGCVSCSS